MLRSWVAWRAELRRSLSSPGCCLLLSFALLLDAACRGDTSRKVDAAIIPVGADAGVPDVQAVLDAGPVNAGSWEAGSLPITQHFAAATAELTASEAFAPDGGVVTLGGTASFRTTSESVDLQLVMHGVVTDAAYLSIVDARNTGGCAQLAPSGNGSALGQGLSALHGFGAGQQVLTGYSRAAGSNAPWTIGGGGASDLVGQALIVRDGALGKLLACGVITRSADVERSPLPPVDRAPTIATRAAIGGVCLGRQYPGSSRSCPDDTALLRCEAVHCAISSCLKSCEAYASCLDQQADACAPEAAIVCNATDECSLCMSEVQTCSKLYCAEDSFCPASPTPDGPCHQLANCSALQGKFGDTNLALLVPLLARLGGDANCIGSMNDWAVLSQWKVPCLFGKFEPPGTSASTPTPAHEPAGSAPLGDSRAGAACKTDAECPGGSCAPVAQEGAVASSDAGGYCTRACELRTQCGHGGTCAPSGSPEGNQCLAACDVQADCRSGFVCAGAVQGSAISVSGACHPVRQPDQLADHTAGRACQVDADCSGGTCSGTNLLGTAYPGNYCTARCYEDAQCGQGGVCLWTRNSDALGYCLAGCNADADCGREDYGCWDMTDGSRVLHACYPLKRALPDRRAGQPCAEDADCGGPPATCAKQLPFGGLATNELIDVPGGYCTQHCSLDRECGEGAQCINYGTSGGLCLATCTSDTTCRVGYACFPHFRNLDESAAVCVAGS
jgi:hypothetical protein